MNARGLDTGVRPSPPFDQGLFLLHLNRGKEELRRSKFDDARRDFEAAQRLRPADPDVVSNLSFALFHLGHFEEAERMTRELLVTHSDSVPLLFNLGLILLKSGRQPEARTTLERVLDLAPGHRKAHLTLGLILQRTGDAAEARHHLRLAGGHVREGTDADDTVARTARAASAEKSPPPQTPAVKPETFEVPRPAEGDAEPEPAPAALEAVAAAERPPAQPPAEVLPEPPAEVPPAAKAESQGTGPSVATAKIRALVAEPAALEAVLHVPATAIALPAPPHTVAAERAGPVFLPVEAAVPFSLRAGGFLSAECRKGILVRRGILTGRSGSPSVTPEARLTGPLSNLLMRAAGDATLLLLDRGRRPFLVLMQGEFLSVDTGKLLAFDAALAYREDPAFEFRRQIARPFLKLFGVGAVALSVASEPERLSVSESQPLTIGVSAVLGYGGSVIPELLEERDPLAEMGSGPVFRFVGAGYVLAEAC